MKYILLLFFFSVTMFAKDYSVTGKVIDENTNTSLPSANVLLYHLPDSTMKGDVTNKAGEFALNNIRAGKYALVIKYLGYQDYSTELIITDKSINVGTIALKPDNIKTDEAIVIGKLPLATQSGDTTIYNANAFKVNKDAMAEDLLKKVPGVQVENGKVKAQGEEVKKVFIDGKSYMGDDPNVAIKNVPADVIDKIQVFDQQSEQSQFTGFNDGNTTKAINFVTRMKVHEGTFGKLFGGYGTDERYATGGSYNYFNDDQRLSLLGQINNTNEQNFSDVDLLGVMGGGGDGGGRFRNRGMNDFLSGARNGEVNTKAFGLNYNDKYFETLESNESYFFNNTDNVLNSSLKRNYLNSEDSTLYNEQSNSRNKNTNHRFNILMNYAIDTMNAIRFVPSFSYQKNNSTSNTIGRTNSSAGNLNYSNSSNTSDLDGINFNSLLMYRHKFNTSGRTISLMLNNSYRRNEGNKKLFSENIFYNSIDNSDTLDQSADILNDGNSIQGDFFYTEPIGTTAMLSISGSMSTSREKSDRETYNFSGVSNNYSLFDTSLSNVYEKRVLSRTGGAGLRYRKNKINFNISLNYNVSTLKSEREFPKKSSVQRDFYAFLPTLMMQYNISRDKNVSLFYRSFTNTPSAIQLQDVIDNSNPLQLTTGNPNLKQEYYHNINMRLSTTNFNNMSTFFWMLGGSFKMNHIGTNTILARRDTVLQGGVLLNSGSQLVYPENYNGYMGLQTYMTYGLPVDMISSTINFNLNGNYTKVPGTLNGIYNSAKTMNYGLGATLSSNISQDLDFTLSSTSSLNTVRNTASRINDDDYFSQSTSLRFYWLAIDRLTFQTNLTHRYIEGLEKPTSYLLNFSLGLKLFENRKGELKLSVYDALNQNNNNSKQTTDTYTQEYSTNLIGRYYLLTFNYNISTFN